MHTDIPVNSIQFLNELANKHSPPGHQDLDLPFIFLKIYQSLFIDDKLHQLKKSFFILFIPLYGRNR